MLRRIPRVTRATSVSGSRLKASLEATLPVDHTLSLLLTNQRFLRLSGLVENLKLGLLVLQHALFRADSGLQFQDALLIVGSCNGRDQLLNRCEAAAAVGQCFLGNGLQQRS